MAISVGTVLRIVANHVMPGNDLAQNVFNCTFSGSPTSTDEADVLTDIGSWLDDLFTSLDVTVDNEVLAGEFTVYQFDPADVDWDEVGSDSGAWTFAGASEMLPHGVAGQVDVLTTDPDVRGRKYIPGIVEGAQEESTLAAAHVANLADFAALWIADYAGTATGGTFIPGIWSPTQGTFRAMLGTAIVNTILGYQRRRKPGVGI